jgi:hypothetical protein
LKLTILDEEMALADEESFQTFTSFVENICKEYGVKISKISRRDYA